MTELAIEVRALHKTYRDGWFGSRKFHALKGINLEVRRGEVFGLLGPNGAGKTTLIKSLLGIVRINQGKANLLGERAGSLEARKKIGYLPENMVFPAHHNATRALKYYGRLSRLPEQEIKQRSQELLFKVGLEGRTRELVRKFSKGMRQRLGLAQAMLHQPDLLILDEPTDGLDPVGRSEIRKIIDSLRAEGKTIFLNSHILQEVELICDRVAILAGGEVRGVGTPAELTSQFAGTAHDRIVMQITHTEAASVRALVDGFNPDWQTTIEQASLNQFRLTCIHKDQSQTDQLIDQLRAQQISILAIDRETASLEDVFLTMVNNPVPESTKPQEPDVLPEDVTQSS